MPGHIKDYYKVLEIDPNASQEEIRNRYLLLINAWHPDKFQNPRQKAEAEERTKEINEAYEVLRTPIKRAQFDAERSYWSAQSKKTESQPPKQNPPEAEKSSPNPSRSQNERNRGETIKEKIAPYLKLGWVFVALILMVSAILFLSSPGGLASLASATPASQSRNTALAVESTPAKTIAPKATATRYRPKATATRYRPKATATRHRPSISSTQPVSSNPASIFEENFEGRTTHKVLDIWGDWQIESEKGNRYWVGTGTPSAGTSITIPSDDWDGYYAIESRIRIVEGGILFVFSNFNYYHNYDVGFFPDRPGIGFLENDGVKDNVYHENESFPIPMDQWFTFRIEVEDNIIRSFINGKFVEAVDRYPYYGSQAEFIIDDGVIQMDNLRAWYLK